MEAVQDGVKQLILMLKQGIINLKEFREAIDAKPLTRFETCVAHQAASRINEGEFVTMTADGEVEKAENPEQPIGIALEDGFVRVDLEPPGARARRRDLVTIQEGIARLYAPSLARRDPTRLCSHAYASTAFAMPARVARRAFQAHHRFQYTERFPEKVVDKAWELLEKFMSPDQYFAFMEGVNIELENKNGDYRLLINRTGGFTILQGPRGAGIVATSGTIHSYRYPLGDEIAAFLDWFRHRTEELITNWNCGTYGIKRAEGGE